MANAKRPIGRNQFFKQVAGWPLFCSFELVLILGGLSNQETCNEKVVGIVLGTHQSTFQDTKIHFMIKTMCM